MKLFPENVSTYGNEIDNLFFLILIFSSIAFFISLFALLYPVFNKKVKATYITGNKWTHLKWVAIPVVLLAAADFVILYVEQGTWAKIEQNPPRADVRIGVTGRQWNWIFTYPGPDNQLYTSDDKVVDQQNSELHIPLNKVVVFDLRATDVVHSFSIPNLRFKQDALPGRNITRWIQATKAGKYEIQCAEICGVLHAKMRNFLVVESEEDYNKFLTEFYQPEKKEDPQLVSVK